MFIHVPLVTKHSWPGVTGWPDDNGSSTTLWAMIVLMINAYVDQVELCTCFYLPLIIKDSRMTNAYVDQVELFTCFSIYHQYPLVIIAILHHPFPPTSLPGFAGVMAGEPSRCPPTTRLHQAQSLGARPPGLQCSECRCPVALRRSREGWEDRRLPGDAWNVTEMGMEWDGSFHRATLRWMVFKVKSHKNRWSRGTPILGNFHMSKSWRVCFGVVVEVIFGSSVGDIYGSELVVHHISDLFRDVALFWRLFEVW